MATRHDHLNDEELSRQHALERSWVAAREALEDDEFVDHLRAHIDRVQQSDAPRLSREEFLAQTDPDD